MNKETKIVEMRFDNAAFERNAAQSMSTLDKLKQSLTLGDSAAKFNQGLANTVSFSAQSLDSLAGLFDKTFHDIGTILKSNIITKGIDAVFNGIKKSYDATIGQIISGGKTRAQNIEQAKFQLEGLKVAWEEIEPDISYAVNSTAYGLDEAARVASQLVASNVEIGDSMKKALRAVSGVAAMTNSSYSEIGHIFTTVAGQGKLMTMQLQQLSTRGLNVAADLAKAMNVTEAEIREMVTKGDISFQMFAEAMDNAYGEHAKEANKTFTGALSNMKAALSRIGALFAAPAYDNLRDVINATTPVINAFKKALEPVADDVQKLMEVTSKLAANILENFNTSIFKKITTPVDMLVKTATNAVKTLSNAHADTTDIEEATEAVREYAEAEIQAAKDIWELGKYGNGQTRIANLEAEGLNAQKVQKYLEEYVMTGKEYVQENKEIEKSDEETMESLAGLKLTLRGLGFSQEAIDSISNVVDILKNIGIVAKNTAESAYNIGEAVVYGLFGGAEPKEYTDSVKGFTERMVDLSEKLKFTKDRAKPLIGIFSRISTAVFRAATKITVAANKVYDFITDFKTAYNELQVLDTQGIGHSSKQSGLIPFAEWCANAAKKVRDLVVTVGDLVKAIGNLSGIKRLGQSIKDVGEAFGRLFKHGGSNTTDEMKSTAKQTESMFNAMDVGLKIIDAIANGIAWVIEGVPKAIDSVGSLISSFTKPIDEDNTSFGSLFRSFTKLFDSGDNNQNDIKKNTEKTTTSVVSGFINGVLDGLKNADWDRIEKIGMLAGIIIVLWKFNDAIVNVSKTIDNIKKFPLGITDAFIAITKFFTDAKKNLSAFTNASAISMIALSVAALVIALTMLADVPKDDLARVAVYTVLIIEALKSLAKANTGISTFTKNVDKSHKNLMSNNKIKGKLTINLVDNFLSFAAMLIAISATLATVIVAVRVFADMANVLDEDGRSNLQKGIDGLVTILVAIALFIGALMAFNIASKIGAGIPKGLVAAILTLSGSIWIIGSAVAMLGLLPEAVLNKGTDVLWTITGCLAAILVIMLATEGLAKVGTNQILALSAFMLVFAASTVIIAGAFALISGVIGANDGKWGGPVLALVSILGTMMVVTAVLIAVLNQCLEITTADLIAFGAMMVLYSVTMVIIAGALAIVANAFKGMDWAQIVLSAGSLILIFALLFETLKGLGGLASTGKVGGDTFVAIALSMLILSAALVVLAGALTIIGTSSADVWVSLKMVALAIGSLFVLGIIGAKVGDGIVRIAVAMTAFGAGALMFGAGAYVLGKAIPLISAALPVLASAFVAFVEAIAADSNALLLFVGILVVVGLAFAAAIFLLTKFGPTIKTAFEGFGVILQGLIGTFNGLSPKLKMAVASAILAIVGGAAMATPEATEKFAEIITNFFTTLAALVDPIVQGLVVLIVAIINSLANAIMDQGGPIAEAIARLLIAAWSIVLALTSVLIVPAMLKLGYIIYTAFIVFLNFLNGLKYSFKEWLFNSILEVTFAAEDKVDHAIRHAVYSIVASIEIALKNIANALGFGVLGDAIGNQIEAGMAEFDKAMDEKVKKDKDLMAKNTFELIEGFDFLSSINPMNPLALLQPFMTAENAGWLLSEEEFLNSINEVTNTYSEDAELMNGYLKMWNESLSEHATVTEDTAARTEAATQRMTQSQAMAANEMSRSVNEHAAQVDRSLAASNQHAIDEMARLGTTAKEEGNKAGSSFIGSFASKLVENGSFDQKTFGLWVTDNMSAAFDKYSSNIDMTSVMDTVDVSKNPDFMSSLSENMTGVGGDIITTISDGATDKQSILFDNLGSIGNLSTDSFLTNADAFTGGSNLIDGYVRGINTNDYKVFDATSLAANKAQSGWNTTLGINSPSKVGMKLGGFFSMGVAIGIASKVTDVTNSVTELANSSITTMTDSLGAISTALSSETELNPTIRPVMDLTNVQSSVGSINSMFSSQSNRLSTINSRLARETEAYKYELDQNSRFDNSDVVSSIGALSSQIGELNEAMMSTQIVMDNGVLVGQLTPGIDKRMGQLSSRKARKN